MTEKSKKAKIVVIVIIALLLVLISAGMIYLSGLMKKINFVSKNSELSYDEIGSIVLDDDDDLVSGADTFEESEMNEYESSI